MQSYNAVPDAAVKTTPTGRRVVLAAALSFCLGAFVATAGAPASKALRGSTNLATTRAKTAPSQAFGNFLRIETYTAQT